MSLIVYKISRGLCDVVARVRSSTAVSCRPEEVEEVITGSFNNALAQATQLGITEKRAYELLYPFVAFVDEVVLRGPTNLRDYWRSRQLQSKIYLNNRGGELFFERIKALSVASPHDKEMVFAYLLVLALGFEGKFHGGEIAELLEVRRGLARIVDQPPAKPNPSRQPKSDASERSYRLKPVMVVGFLLVLTSASHMYLRMRYETYLGEVVNHIEHMRIALHEMDGLTL